MLLWNVAAPHCFAVAPCSEVGMLHKAHAWIQTDSPPCFRLKCNQPCERQQENVNWTNTCWCCGYFWGMFAVTPLNWKQIKTMQNDNLKMIWLINEGRFLNLCEKVQRIQLPFSSRSVKVKNLQILKGGIHPFSFSRTLQLYFLTRIIFKLIN